MQVGNIYSDHFSFTQEDLSVFCDLVGDINPIHRDSDCARRMGFKNCLVQGLFAVAVLSARASKLMPAFIEAMECSRKTQFIRPIFIEDEVALSCEVIDLDLSRGIGIVRERLKNGKGQICIDSTVETKILKLE